jgi:trigger factor
MAENENQIDTATQEQPFSIRVEDAGPATKKIFVEVPQERVSRKIEDTFKEVRQGAMIPGFRKGRVPQQILRKRFDEEIKDQVRRDLINASYQQALTDNNLQVIGEPEFENPDAIKVEPDKPLAYSFSVEIQPTIELPDLAGLKVTRPRITITDEHINQAMTNLREQQGALVPVEDRGVENRDLLIADVRVKIDGNQVSQQLDAQLVSRPGRIAGFQVDNLDAQLAGARLDEVREVIVTVPDDHPTEALRGKQVHIEIAVKDIKRLQPAEINADFLDQLGFNSEQDLRDALRAQMEERIGFDVQQAVRRQVIDQLLEKVDVELPVKLSSRQADRVVSRRAIDLMMRGVSRDRIDANIEALRQGAEEEGGRELKRYFILNKVAEDNGVDVEEGELNSRIAMIAMQQGARPERLKQSMAKDGTLANLYIQMREEKAVDKLLEKAEIEEVEPSAEQQQAVAAQPGEELENQAPGAQPQIEQKEEPKAEDESSAT